MVLEKQFLKLSWELYLTGNDINWTKVSSSTFIGDEVLISILMLHLTAILWTLES